MNQRNRNARLRTGGLVGVPPGYGDEHWNDVTLMLNGSSLTDDLSTASNDVSQTASAVTLLSTTGPYGTTQDVLDFDRNDSDSYLKGAGGETGITDLDDGSVWTMECWVMLDDLGADNGSSTLDNQGVFGVGTTNTQNSGIVVRWKGTQWFWWVGGWGLQSSFTRPRKTGQWQHIALVYDGVSSSTLYVDGVASTAGNRACALGASDKVVLGRQYPDFAENPLDGKIADFRITKGVARYTSNFTPPTKGFPTNAPGVGRRGVGTYHTGDEHWDDVTLLIRGDTLTDLSGNNTLTNNGAAAGDTSPVKFSTGSLYFDGSNSSITVPDAATPDNTWGDFTIEFWFNSDALNKYQMFFGTLPSNGDVTYVAVHGFIPLNTNKPYFTVSDGTQELYFSTSAAVSMNTWYHYAATRHGNTVRFFLNGVQQGSSQTLSGNLHNPTNPFRIGRSGSYTSNNGYNFSGNIEDFRITKGVARYTANFTPPTESFPTVLAGTPEATATLRTRGFVGAAPAGSGILTLYDRYVGNLS